MSAEQVQRALRDVRRERFAEHRRAEARALAAELDGVSQAEVERAFEKVEAELRASRESGERPRRRDLAAVLARELGKSRSEIRRAFRTAHRKRFEAKLAEAVREGRISEAQADRIRERMRNGFPGRGRRFGGGHHGPGGPGGLFFGGPPPAPVE